MSSPNKGMSSPNKGTPAERGRSQQRTGLSGGVTQNVTVLRNRQTEGPLKDAWLSPRDRTIKVGLTRQCCTGFQQILHDTPNIEFLSSYDEDSDNEYYEEIDEVRISASFARYHLQKGAT